VSCTWNGQILYDYHNVTNVNPPPSIVDYGAAGDGVTNSTAASQSAALVNARITVPAGTYVIKDTIDLNGAYFVGDGWGTATGAGVTKLAFQNLGTKPAIRTTQANTKSATVGLENLEVVANSWHATSGCVGYGL